MAGFKEPGEIIKQGSADSKTEQTVAKPQRFSRRTLLGKGLRGLGGIFAALAMGPSVPQPSQPSRTVDVQPSGMPLGTIPVPTFIPGTTEVPPEQTQELPPTELPAEISMENFEQLGIGEFWNCYKRIADTEQKFGTGWSADFFNPVIANCARIANGEVPPGSEAYNNLVEGWGESEAQAVPAALAHVSELDVYSISPAHDDPQEVKEKFKRFAQTLAPLALALPQEILLQDAPMGVMTTERLLVKSFEVFGDPAGWEQLIHEDTHAFDFFYDRVKAFTTKEKFLNYIGDYYELADEVMTASLTLPDAASFAAYWEESQFGAMLALRTTNPNETNARFSRLEAEIFGNATNAETTGDGIRLSNLVYAIGRSMLNISQKREAGLSLSEEETRLTENQEAKDLMTNFLKDSLHTLVDSPEEYVLNPQPTIQGDLAKVRKEMNDFRIRTFATFPLDPSRDPMQQLKEQLPWQAKKEE